MITKRHIKSILNRIITRELVNISEYQDRYFFVEQFKQAVPMLNEVIVYRALEEINNSYPYPVKKRIFISKFTDKLF